MVLLLAAPFDLLQAGFQFSGPPVRHPQSRCQRPVPWAQDQAVPSPWAFLRRTSRSGGRIDRKCPKLVGITPSAGQMLSKR